MKLPFDFNKISCHFKGAQLIWLVIAIVIGYCLFNSNHKQNDVYDEFCQ